MRENLGFKVGDIVLDMDGYEAKIVEIDPSSFDAILDYSDFSSDVPAEDTKWALEELELADEDAEAERVADLGDRSN